MYTFSDQSATDQACVDDEHPWPGLASFREQDARFFKGRKPDIEELDCLVNRKRLTVLFGVSGLGKSSLLQAGLFPKLRLENKLPIIIRLDFNETALSLNQQVFVAIACQVQQNAIAAPLHHENETLWEYFHRKDAEFWDARNRMMLPLLCFDQFEEVFTLGRENPKRADDAEKFILELADLVEGRCPESVKARLGARPDDSKNFSFSQHPYKLIFSLREDYLANLEELRQLMPAIIHNRMRLLPMSGNQALAVADQTAGRLMERSVAESVVRLLAGESGEHRRELSDLQIEPALLSLVCRELNELRIKSRAGKIDAEAVKSNREQILEDFYERSLQDQAPELRRFIEDELITVSGYRNSEAYDNALGTPGITAEALDNLVQRRLLVLQQEERDGVKRIELIHDVLTGVVRKSRDQRLAKEMQAQAEYREQIAREALRRSKRRTMLFVMLSSVFLVTAAWGWWNWWDAKRLHIITLSGKLAAQAALLADTAPDDSVVESAAALAIESWRLQHNPKAFAAADKLFRMLPKVRIPHAQEVMAIAFSADGSLLATGSIDNRLRVFETKSGSELYRIEQGGSVTSVDFSPDGRFLATGSKDKTTRLFEIAQGKEVFRLVYDGEVGKVIFSPDSQLLATYSRNQAYLIDVKTGKELRPIKHANDVNNIAFSTDSLLLATASRDHNVRLIETSAGKERLRVDVGAEVTHVVFSFDNRLLGVASRDDTARLLDVTTGKPLRKIHHGNRLSSIAFSPDGLWLASGSVDKTAKVTGISSGMEIANFLNNRAVFSVRFSPNGRLLAISSLDGTARLIETTSWQEVARIMHGAAAWDLVFSRDSQLLATDSMDNAVRLIETVKNPDDIKIKQNAAVMGIAFNPNGGVLAAASQDKTAGIFDIRTGKQVMKIEHADVVYGVAFSWDGRFLATSSKDHTAKLINAATGKEIALISHSGEVRSIAFSADSRWLATGSQDKSVKIINTATGEQIRHIKAGDEVRFVAFSFDSRLLAIAGKDGALDLISTQTWQPVKAIKLPAPLTSLAFSPDGRHLATASEDHLARIIGVNNGLENAQFAHDDSVLNVAISPDGKLLATSSLDNTARLFDINSGKLKSSIKHGGTVTAIAFSPSGRFLATASLDSTTRLVETQSGLEVQAIPHSGVVWSVAFSPDEQLLAAGVGDGHVQLHAADPQTIFELLCDKAGRNLNREELHDYLDINVPHRTCKDWRESASKGVSP